MSTADNESKIHGRGWSSKGYTVIFKPPNTLATGCAAYANAQADIAQLAAQNAALCEKLIIYEESFDLLEDDYQRAQGALATELQRSAILAAQSDDALDCIEMARAVLAKPLFIDANFAYTLNAASAALCGALDRGGAYDGGDSYADCLKDFRKAKEKAQREMEETLVMKIPKDENDD